MRLRLRYLAPLLAAAAFAWAAAPALSVRPYTPAAVDFEQPLSGVERVAGQDASAGASMASPRRVHVHAGEGPVTHVSEAIAAPHRFDLVGLAGEMRALELRARDEGGEWSDWIETANGDPVYFGGADDVQLRTRGWRPEGRLHYVNVSGTTSDADALLNGAREAINGAFISVASLVQPEATAAPIRPDYISRGEWGAKGTGGCVPREGAVRGKVKAAVVHHTVTSADYTPEEAPSIVLGICRYHRNANGWNDIGYNALVDQFGTIYMGRAGGLGKTIVGAHAQGFNAQTTGIAAIGTHTSVPITEESLSAFAELIAWKLDHHGRPVLGKAKLRSAGGSLNRYRAGRKVRKKRIIGHGQLDLTACPGGSLKAQLRDIRHRAQAIINGKVVKPPPPKKPPPEADTGGIGG